MGDDVEDSLHALFNRALASDPQDDSGIGFWARSMVLYVQDQCAWVADFHGCDRVAAEIRALRWGPDYQDEELNPERPSEGGR